MPEPRLYILVCASLAPELEALAGSLPAEVFLGSYPARCGRPQLTWDDLAGLLPELGAGDRVEVLGCRCLDTLGRWPAGCRLQRLEHCFSPVAGDSVVAHYQERGQYLVTSGWLGEWPRHLADQGLSGAAAAALFAESVAGIVHLDTGVLPEAERQLEAFAGYLDRPHRTVWLGLDQLRLRVEAVVASWRAELKEARLAQRLNQTQRKNADYAMVLDLLKLIVQTTGKDAVQREILQLYQMMFAAREVAYLPIAQGSAATVTRVGPGSPETDRGLKEAALTLEEPFRVLPSGAGFLLRVDFEGRVLGVVCVDRIALPDHLEQYLQVARETVVVCAVVLNNALNLEHLLAVSRQLMLNEAALRESEQTYHSLFQESSAIQLLIDPGQGDIVDANDAAVAFYGYPLQQLTALGIPQINDLPKAQVMEEMGRAVRGEVSHFLFRHRVAGGELRSVEIYSTAVRVGGRTLLHTIVHDITERVRAEEANRELERRLRLAHKAQSLGRMAAAIAHKYNNLLGAVLGNLELALLDLPAQTRPVANITEALKAAARAAEVSILMLTYLGQVPGRLEDLDLAALCGRSVPALELGLPPGVALVLEGPPAGLWVSGSEQQLQQLLASLVTNAWEALGGRPGQVRVVLGTASAAEIEVANRFPPDWEPEPAAQFCRLEVADDGCGISEADIGELFDPFFSSKFTGRGLGLPIVLGVVRSHHGAVTVASAPGVGSSFRVYLPHLEPCLDRLAESPRQLPQPAPYGTVLLVEDEVAVRKTAGAMLAVAGYAVLEARDGTEALKLYREHRAEVRLVLSDLTMPGADGWTTLAALRELDPELPAILTSGYDQSQVMCGEHPHWPQAFLRKPYGLSALKDALRQALAQSP